MRLEPLLSIESAMQKMSEQLFIWPAVAPVRPQTVTWEAAQCIGIAGAYFAPCSLAAGSSFTEVSGEPFLSRCPATDALS